MTLIFSYERTTLKTQGTQVNQNKEERGKNGRPCLVTQLGVGGGCSVKRDQEVVLVREPEFSVTGSRLAFTEQDLGKQLSRQIVEILDEARVTSAFGH